MRLSIIVTMSVPAVVVTATMFGGLRFGANAAVRLNGRRGRQWLRDAPPPSASAGLARPAIDFGCARAFWAGDDDEFRIHHITPSAVIGRCNIKCPCPCPRKRPKIRASGF